MEAARDFSEKAFWNFLFLTSAVMLRGLHLKHPDNVEHFCRTKPPLLTHLSPYFQYIQLTWAVPIDSSVFASSNLQLHLSPSLTLYFRRLPCVQLAEKQRREPSGSPVLGTRSASWVKSRACVHCGSCGGGCGYLASCLYSIRFEAFNSLVPT